MMTACSSSVRMSVSTVAYSASPKDSTSDSDRIAWSTHPGGIRHHRHVRRTGHGGGFDPSPIQFEGFLGPAYDQLCTHAARMRGPEPAAASPCR